MYLNVSYLVICFIPTQINVFIAAWKVPINVMQDSYDRVKSSPAYMNRRKRPRFSNAFFGAEENELQLQVVISNPHPPCMERKPRVLFSGVGNLPEQTKRVIQLGCLMAESCKQATHLIMVKPMRTYKLFSCLSSCKFILSLHWLTDSYNENTLLCERPYVFKDTEFEKTNDFSIKTILRTRTRGELFKGKIFHVTPGVIPSPIFLHEIIECAGGMVDRQRKPLKRIQEYEPNTYLIITISNDLHLVTDVLRANIGVYDSEFILSAILKQKLNYDTAVKMAQFLKK